MGVESRLNTADASELDQLIRQNPDWIRDYPDLYRTLNPVRYGKNKNYLKGVKTQVSERRSGPAPVTDYQATYQPHDLRPRSTKRPPPSPRDHNPPPMTFSTNQRTEFVPKDIGARAKIIEPKENYEPPTEPFVGVTKYTEDFPVKYAPLPNIHGHAKVTEGHIKRSTATFDGRTTYKEQHVAMNPNPSLSFGELPSFADSILYPEKRQHQIPDPTTRATFQGRPGPRADLCEKLQGNIRLEDIPMGQLYWVYPEGCNSHWGGDMDHATMNSLTYRQHEGARPAERVDPRPRGHPTVPAARRDKLIGETQFSRDFAPRGPLPLPPRPVTPPPTTIDLKFDNQTSYSTEQRQQFPGIDAAKHPQPKSCKKDPETYQKPTVRMETTTNQKQDYQPLDVAAAYVAPVKQKESSRTGALPRFEGHTTVKDMYKRCDVQPRKRYVDFHETNNYVPPQNKFEGSTTTGETFVGACATRPKDFKPEVKRIELDGSHDFNTVYRHEYNPRDGLVRRLAPSEAKFLLKELRKKRHQQPVAT